MAYIMENLTQNCDICNFNVNIRNSRTLSIGTTICILSPCTVEILTVVDIKLLVTNFKDIIMKSSPSYFPLSNNNHIQGNISFYFVVGGATLNITGFTLIRTSWCGFICDKPRIIYWTITDHGFGLYLIYHHASPIGFEDEIEVKTY